MLTNQIASFQLLYEILCICCFLYMFVRSQIYLLALANKGTLTILFVVEEIDFIIYVFVYSE